MALTADQRNYFDRAFPPNFSLAEMVEGSRGRGLPGILAHAEEFWESLTYEQAQNLCILAWKIQLQLRDVLKMPVFVSNAYRPEWYEVSRNRTGKGAHPKGMAADLNCANNAKLIKLANERWIGGVGTYAWGVHVDNMPHRRWQYICKNI
jgi:uncharacterized protein YcbK (DUF882 family)